MNGDQENPPLGLPAPPHAPREQPFSVVGGGTPTVLGMDVVAIATSEE